MPEISNAKGPMAGRIQVALIGCNHRTAPVELRERVAFTPQQALDAADELRRRGILEEALVLSTCNRSELYGVPGESGAMATDAMRDFLTSFHRISAAELNGRIYGRAGPEAVRHLFRVAAGLDSMLLGEAEILGQLRTAYGQALEHGTTGPVLNRLFQGALETGKRVRAETEIGARPVSVALAGVKLAEHVFGSLKGRVALIIGAGAVAEQVAEHLRNRGIGSLRVVNRSYSRAAELAGEAGGEALAWESLEAALGAGGHGGPGAPDMIIASAGGIGAFLTREMLERSIAARGGRPIFVADLGVPRNAAPDAAGVYNLYLYNVDDLGEIVEQNKKAREAEIPRAEAIVAEQSAKFEAWRQRLETRSVLDDLRNRFGEQREGLLRERLGESEGVSPEERERIARITGELIERILSQPAERLRNEKGMRGRVATIEALRYSFGLDATLGGLDATAGGLDETAGDAEDEE